MVSPIHLFIIATCCLAEPQITPPADLSYREVLDQVDKQRAILAGKMGKVDDDKLVNKATTAIDDMIRNQMTPFWLGTPWGYNGTTRQPGRGQIACGYFVTTLLQDAGFQINRVKLAQAPSEKMIRSLVGPQHIRRYSNKPLKAFLRDIKAWGHGLYIVGLDNHTGFISVSQEGVFFIHSAFVDPAMVVMEKAADSLILDISGYRVLGKLTGKTLIWKWLKGELITSRL